MRITSPFAVILVAIVVSSPATADWTLTGVAAICDSGKGKFALLSVVSASDEAVEYVPSEVKAGAHLLAIQDGRNALRCQLNGTHRVFVDLVNAGPSARGS